MKKIIFILISTFLFANFIPNKKYECQNIGVSIKKDKKNINIANTKQTKEKLKKILNSLYSLSFRIDKKNLILNTKNFKDILVYLKNYKGLKVYSTKDANAFIFLDNNSSTLILAKPTSMTDNIKIYYKCK